MSSNAFMLPVLPQPSTADFNGIDKTGTKSFKTARTDAPADGDRDFLTTLNRISDRETPDRHESPTADQTARASEHSDQGPPNS